MSDTMISTDGSDAVVVDGGHAGSTSFAAYPDVSTTSTIFSGVHSRDLQVAQTETLVVKSGGSVTSTTVLGREVIEAGGSALGDIIGATGAEDVKGGLTRSATVQAGGQFSLASGGRAIDAFLSSGASATFASARATGTVIDAGADLLVSAGGVLVGGLVSGVNRAVEGLVTAFSGAVMSDVVASGGIIYVSAGAVARETVLRGSSFLEVDGGAASATVISRNGWEVVAGGGRAIGDIVSSGGTTNVFGASTDLTLSSGAHMLWESGAKVTDLTILPGVEIDAYLLGSTSAVISGGVLDVIKTGKSPEVMLSATLNGGGAGLAITSTYLAREQTTEFFFTSAASPGDAPATNPALLAQTLAAVGDTGTAAGSGTTHVATPREPFQLTNPARTL